MFEGLRPRHCRAELRDDGIAVITLDRADKPVNALAQALIDEIGQLVERMAIEPPKGLVFMSAKDGGFSPGADIGEFEGFFAQGTIADAISNGHRVFDAIARLRCPTVAAIHGHCFGGGMELSLACDYRVAADTPDTRLGLPEVKLGIHPGWGGLARLPHLVGAPEAMRMMLAGGSLSASRARAIGLVDGVVPREDLMAKATDLVRTRPARPFRQRLTAWATNTWPARVALAPTLRKTVQRKAPRKHYPAPYAMIDVWRKHGGSVAKALRPEIRSVVRLAGTPTAHNLVRVYFLQEGLKARGAGTGHGIHHVHVIGAGVMGGDIAAWAAMQGFNVTLQDQNAQAVQAALARAGTLFEKRLKTADRIEAARRRLAGDPEGARVGEADLVIEAIVEKVEVKRALFADIEPKMKPDALLATNTSSIVLEDLREGLARPQNFIGLHYFNPVPMLPLVEVVHHDQASGESLRRGLAFVRGHDKLPLAAASAPGFLVNRILFPYLLEAFRLREEGVPLRAIDEAAVRFGMPMGPVELADQVGLDVCAHVGAVIAPKLGVELPGGVEALIAAGKRGRKDGEGFYTYPEGKAVKPPLPENYVPPVDLEDRLILPLLNEAVACLHEGIVASADELDAGVIFGTGFAPFRGGPIQHIRAVGKDEVIKRLTELAKRHGPRFAPRPGWSELAS
ncbi:3-hydroxyacyl-CoA dehydrogenase NAD-binding domain-containing protein [Pseudofulvimonas gallinarii]|jgi:3-hydroxyacyl-CoA dehydrogenase/enoyl-CoA hydratase/3-hydroxybutyryl-CoA epimerase|uniref:enoyl-CoA hydratase n=1 Tax=Pseudofulvimonas gallinarii TaxID=634155 RepID=A0A4S3KW91_9GAMM|nr:3-hydroxyacyl-CoA dehydrogenase NAD-binding domain-containing protein [Pseudofulvimonas gallinarii]TCT00063.1 short chain enoyl-CoA hydratase /3-hydroxyacyl-CoA dehydrogenase [Pseudofulvimonas gallinarii]THD13537.1 3-hydroxyacyl-CoA dehydrogenase [Pseudofulvimonas gallinarii]